MEKGFSGNIVIETNNNIREFKTDNKRRTKSCKDISKYKEDIICPCCKGIRINKFGKQNNKQRYICRDCRKTFILEDDDRKKYSEEFKDEVIKLYLEGMGIRAIERIKQVPNTLVLQWINKYAQRIRDKATELISNIDNNIKNNVEIMEIDENKPRVLKKSSKLDFGNP